MCEEHVLRPSANAEATRRTVVKQFDLDAYADNLVAYYNRAVQSWKG